ncbi:MAG: DUF4199 domain-containing protein [Prevotella sp.]|jgi:hypothetical protein
MMNIVALVQVKAFARQEGVFLALLWIASFLLMVYIPSSSWGSLLAMSTPFFVGWRLVGFRNYALDGVISFKRGFAFSWYTFFYASLIFAVVQYIFFRYFDHGAMLSMLSSNVEVVQETYKAGGVNDNQAIEYMKEGMNVIGMMSPIELAFVFMMQNFFMGTLLSLPIAFFCKKSEAKH